MPTPVGLDVAITHTRAAVSEAGSTRQVASRTVVDWPSLFDDPKRAAPPPRKSFFGRLFGGSSAPQGRPLARLADATIRQIRQSAILDGPVAVAVPAYFADRERSAVAGLLRDFSIHLSRIINAPHAAALVHASATLGPIVVIQAETTTWDVSVGNFVDDLFELRATDGAQGNAGADAQQAAMARMFETAGVTPEEVQAAVVCGGGKDVSEWATDAATRFPNAAVHADDPTGTIARGAAILAAKAEG